MATTMRDETMAGRCGELDWQGVDARLRDLAQRAAAHEWELGLVLLRARQTRAHEQLGFASLFEYVDRLLGLSPRMVAERLRVAEALADLPALTAALRGGDRSWSAVREITRVATPETEGEWLAWSAGKTVRELEQAVSGLRAGDRPGDPPDPHLVRRVIRVEVSAEAFALFKDAMCRVRRDTDAGLTEEDTLAELCRRALGARAAEGDSPYQVALTVCDHCGRTWQDAGGETIELPAEVGERAMCDAQHLGRVDEAQGGAHVGGELPAIGERGRCDAQRRGGVDEAPGAHMGGAANGDTHVGRRATRAIPPAPPAATGDTHVGRRATRTVPPATPAATGDAHVGRRATRTVPPATRRLVLRRDKGRCRVPGCRNHVYLDLHHLRPRAEGGTHHPSGLILLCGSHHALHHRGLLIIEGADEREARFRHADGTPYGEAPRPADVQASAEAHGALRSLGFTETESRTALAAARTHVGAGATTEELVRAALRARAKAA